MTKGKWLILIITVLTLITGCFPQQNRMEGEKPTSEYKGSESSTRPVAASTPTLATGGVDVNNLNGLQIHFLHPWSGEIQKELALMVDQFNQTNEWGIHVIMDAPGSAGMVAQTVWEKIAQEKPVNVVAAPISLLLAIDEKENLVVDLVPYFASRKNGMDRSQRDDFTPVFWEEDNVEGKQYGIPAQRTASIMIYNATWANELGYDQAPATPEEFQQQVCAANAVKRLDTDFTNDGVGGWIINTNSSVLLNWLTSFDADIDQNQNVQFATPGTEATFTYLFGLARRACAWTGKMPQPYTYFAQRQTLIYSGQLQDIHMQARIMNQTGSTDEWQAIPFPGLDGRPVITSGFSYGILEASPEQDLAAWLFIRWMSDPVQQARMLKASGTLPLGTQVMTQMKDYSTANPQWEQAVGALRELVIQPKTADWMVIEAVLEDAGWQVFNSETKVDMIPAVIEQLDSITTELAERYP